MIFSTTMKIRFALLLSSLLVANPCTASAADNLAVCTSLLANASLIETAGGHKLVLTVANPSDAAIDLTAFYFESDMLRLSAVEKESNRSLRTLVPLVTPGVAPIRIPANEKFVREFDLGSIFPDLESTLRRSAVGVSWRLKLAPDPGCFAEVIETTVLIPRSAAAQAAPSSGAVR